MTALYWPSISAFVDMGGYGPYVWGSFGVVALTIGLELWWVRRALPSGQTKGRLQ